MKKQLALSILTIIALACPALAIGEGRGEHKTKVTCDVKSLIDAKNCFKNVAINTPSENDPSAVVASDSKKSKNLLVEILTSQENTKDIALVNKAQYFAAVVQNDDEASIYYYILTNGKNVKPTLVGSTINFVEFSYFLCPSSEDEKSQYDRKFSIIKNLLLGMDPNKTVSGVIWLEDIDCSEV
jgi:hypothetical protein